jgi:hypothetical protein
MRAIQVFRVDFDYLENNSSAARHETLLGTFIEKEGLSPSGNANKFLETVVIKSPQIRYDGQVYPHIIYKTIEIS